MVTTILISVAFESLGVCVCEEGGEGRREKERERERESGSSRRAG